MSPLVTNLVMIMQWLLHLYNEDDTFLHESAISQSFFFPKKRHDRRLFLNSLKINNVEAQVEFTSKVMERAWGHMLLM